jgi:hypothetical protein
VVGWWWRKGGFTDKDQQFDHGEIDRDNSEDGDLGEHCKTLVMPRGKIVERKVVRASRGGTS